MQFSPRPGDAVTARGARWVVVDVRTFNECRLITLSGTAPPVAGVERRLLHPFDRVDATERLPAPRVVGGARWRAACRAAIADDTPPGALRRARAAGIDLLPHQLEPALSILAGRGCRLLLADEVGLGKTIQAGLILAELLARAWIERVLVLTPAGLRDQWTTELAQRFGIDAALISGSSLRRLAATLPIGMNPWSAVPLAVASTDYVKRTEVLPAVSACRWDAIVVDEAHGDASDSDRRAAVQALAARASYVLLLTATPHSGDREAFASLCRLGAVDGDRLLVFRRRRADVRAGHPRRVRALRVRLTPAERAMHAALARYSEALRAERGEDACLALSVLHKRAFSSPWSVAQSVERRLAALEGSAASPDVEQLTLPLGDPEGDESEADRPPAWPGELALVDQTRDRRLLSALLDASRAAAAADRKLAALTRLLRRANESAIVFTEYRDTLRHVERRLAGRRPIVTLHGGMTREERITALAQFEGLPRAVLVATDAAGEGLNLQRGCRLVVNLELPWNPMRLEQRIGRVDRIGQTRIVHAVHLVAEGTGEARILERLQARVARAQADIGAPDPVSGDGKRIAQLAVAGTWCDETEAPRAELSSVAICLESDHRGAGVAEAARVERARALVARRPHRDGHVGAVACDGPLVVRAARARLRSMLGSKALLVWQLAWEDRAGRTLESRLVAVLIDGFPRASRSADMKQTVRQLAEHLAPSIESIAEEWLNASAASIGAFAETRLVRERAILASSDVAPLDQFQPGLFDRRAERNQRLARDQAGALQRQFADRITAIERATSIVHRAPALLFAVLP